MKRMILAITAAIFVSSIIISACLTSYTQPINVVNETPEISNENEPTTNMETTENGEKPQESEGTNAPKNQNCNINDAEKAENQQNVASNESSKTPVDTSQNENAWTDTCPPDGRIYWTPEPPYAYVPTYTPKGWTNLPIIPPELEN